MHVNLVNLVFSGNDPGVVIDGNDFNRSNTTDFAIVVDNSSYDDSHLTIKQNNFVGHNSGTSSYAIYVTTLSQDILGGYLYINAKNNWWNSSSGPHDFPSTDGTSNNNSAGDRVTDGVAYSPFATTAF